MGNYPLPWGDDKNMKGGGGVCLVRMSKNE